MTVLKKTTILLLLILGANFAFAGPIDDIVKRAKQSLAAGDYKAASTVVDSALAGMPSDFKLLITKADILFAQKDFAGALGFYEQAVAQKNKDADALYGAGFAALNSNQGQKAVGYFERGVNSGKRKPDFYYGLGLAQLQIGSLSEADVTLRKAIKANPKIAAYHEALGDINFKKQVWSFAINEYLLALTLDSSKAEIYNQLAKSYFQSADFTNAVKYFKVYLGKVPSDTLANHDAARIFEASKSYAEAAFFYQKLTEINPNNGDYWYGYGQNNYNIKEYEKAGQGLEKAVALNSHVAESYKSLAKIYQLRKEYYKADSAYSRFEKELGPPNEAEYWVDKGKVMIKLGETDTLFINRAIESFDMAIKLDSTNSLAWEFAGLSRYYKKQYREAIPFLQKKLVLEGASPNVNTLRNLAFCFLKTEQYDQALANLEAAIKINPDDAIMQQMIGNIYKFKAVYDKAADHFKLALRDTTNAITPADKCKMKGNIGYCYVALRECQSAIPFLEDAVQCDSKNEDVNLSMAQAYHLCNEIKKANTYYKKVLEINPKNKSAQEGAARTSVR
jgi:tetratricopeptide (TPR) repeat protein